MFEEKKTIYNNPSEHPPRLICLWNHAIHEFSLAGQQSLGRPSKSGHPDLPVPIRTVSRKHGTFFTTQEGCAYRDQNSSNGTLLNGRRLLPDRWQELRDGDRLLIHGIGDSEDETDVLLLYSTTYHLNAIWQALPLKDSMEEIQIGRETELRLTDPDVSRLHASFFHSQGGWAILDHESLDGVYLNNRRVTEPRYLMSMDVVRIAGYLFLFTGDCLYYQEDEAALHREDADSSVTKTGTLTIRVRNKKSAEHRGEKQ